uniref:Luc7-like protein 3 n=1 Tax=Plectus sambesii TaxID=2011161 RepID=A0A914V9I2_9BILA
QVVEQADNHKAARDQLKRALVGAPAPVTDDGMAKQMEVCKICGCFLIVNDAQQRIDEHFLGKQHVGFAKIKATMEEFERRIAEKETQKHSTRDEPRKNKDKERRRSRSKERPSTHSSSSSHRTSRDRSETHREPSTRRRSRSREGRDRRHQDRPHSDRDRDRDRHHRHERDEPSRRDNDRKRHSPSKDRSKDRSKERHSRRNGDTR